MIKFLDDVKTSDRGTLAMKCGSLLVESFVREMVETGIVCKKRVLTCPRSLATAGCSTISAIKFAKKAISTESLPGHNRLRQLLKLSIDLTSAEAVAKGIS